MGDFLSADNFARLGRAETEDVPTGDEPVAERQVVLDDADGDGEVWAIRI